MRPATQRLLEDAGGFLLIGAADENLAAVDQVEPVADERENLVAVYPEALVAADEGVFLQRGQQLLGALASDERIV